MKKEKNNKTRRALIRLKVSGISPKLVFAFGNEKERLDLIESTKSEPINSNYVKSSVLLIEQYIENIKDQGQKEYWLPFLTDVKKIFSRNSKIEELNLVYLYNYIWAFRDEFSLNEAGKLIRISKTNSSKSSDIEIPLSLLRQIFLFLLMKNGKKILKTIMVCKVCNKLYANRRASVCSKDCNTKFQNNKKSEQQYFSNYNRQSDNKSVKKNK